jgi:hypothetical protein
MIIEDFSIAPFYIEVDNYNHTVFETKLAKDKSKTVSKQHGHYSNMPSALRYIAMQKVIMHNQEKTISLKQYIEQYNAISNNITNLIK